MDEQRSPGTRLRIAWIGPYPDEGGVLGVATELLDGLSALGHEIDFFVRARERPVPPRLAGRPNLRFVWGTLVWNWNRWYSRGRMGAFISGLLGMSIATRRLRREMLRRHKLEPYDLVYQFSAIETIAVSRRLSQRVPLVIHPETHIVGELRHAIAERRLALASQGRAPFALVLAIMVLRAGVQRFSVGRARLLVCISAVFRDHLVRDYRFPRERTAVVPNPVEVERFAGEHAGSGDAPTVLVLGRVAVRKGVPDAVAVARLLHERGSSVRFRFVGGPSLWSDYTALLEDLPANAEYAGERPFEEMPAELSRADVLLQASTYEPFGLTVGEALAAGTPVVGTSEVGAIEGVDESVAAEVRPGDTAGLADAVEATLERLSADPHGLRELARREARRLFATERVCQEISDALVRMVEEDRARAGGA
jgi:glycosyltransferase involved in cell wall biosynthesis